jgi:V-type H+-transporting ATPase subunit a
MSFLRSEEMKLYMVFFSYSNRWTVMDKLGSLDALHFVDVNPDAENKQGKREIQRCSECDRDVAFLAKTAQDEGIAAPAPLTYVEIERQLKVYAEETNQSRDYPGFFELIERDVLAAAKVSVMNDKNALADLQDQTNILEQRIQALEYAQRVFARGEGPDAYPGAPPGNADHGKAEEKKEQLGREIPRLGATRRIAVLRRDEALAFQRLLFRSLRGNVAIVLEDIPNPFKRNDGKLEYKSIALVIFKGGETMAQKVERVCSPFTNISFDIPEDIDREIEESNKRLQDIRVAMTETKARMVRKLSGLMGKEQGETRLRLESIKYMLDQYKLILTTLGKMHFRSEGYEGVCWCREKEKDRVLIEKGSVVTFLPLQPRPSFPPPPTFIRANDFLSPFQGIVNTYGVPAYREVNPALFTIITFPFMFGIMFGDVLHGMILLVTGVYLLFANPGSMEQAGSILRAGWPFRYLLVLLGLFSVYCGLIYNEVGSIPLPLFRSCYSGHTHITKLPCTYPLGMDPIWNVSANDLIFTNSFKMKFATIVAFLHMFLGIVLKGVNSIHFNNMTVLFCEVFPEVIFTLAILGYLIFLIVYKWVLSWGSGAAAPSLLSMVFQVFLGAGQQPTVRIFGMTPQLILNTVLLGKEGTRE